jgi:foldase protein PrsA
VTVTKAEIVNWAFTDKPPLLTTTVERMIQERVVLQEAKKQGITLTDAEIKARMTTALDSARKNYKMTGLNDAATLKAIGIRSEYLRSFVTPQLALEKLLKKEASAKGEGASEEVREASHILVQVQPDPADPAKTEKAFTDAKAKIDQIAADIRDKKITFEDAAAQHNADSTKFSRGSLGVFTRGQMVPEFDKAVFSLGKGVVSEPVRTQFGWHLVRVDKLSGDITGPQKAEILQRSLSQKMPQMVQQLMTKAKITNTVPPAPQPQGGMMMGGQ